MSAVMSDHSVMDPELITAIFGPAIDPREMISKMGPDQADVHVNTPEWKKKTKRGTALFAGATGVASGPAAVYAAAKSPALKRKTGAAFRSNPKNAGPILGKLHKIIKPGTKAGKLIRSPKALVAGAGAATALQVANMAGDGVVVQEFAPKRKKKITKKLAQNNLKPMMTPAGDQMKQVNNMFAPLKNNSLTPLAGKPAPVAPKPIGTLSPKPTLNKPVLSKPKLPKPLAPQGSSAPAPVQKNTDVIWETEICKVDTDKRQVFGWATVTHVDGKEVVDLQDDYIPLEEIEKAAYSYVLDSRVGGDQHARENGGPKHTMDLIESVIFSPEKVSKMGFDPDTFPKMGWWLGMHVNDEEQWQLVKSDKRQGISIHGQGNRTTKEI